MINEAIKLHQLGLKIIPTDNDKRPLCKWKSYQESQSLEEVKKLFSKKCHGMALLTGKGIEVIDVDCKYFLEGVHQVENIFDALFDAVGEETYSKLLVTHTKSKGFHVIYKTNISEGNQKLASRYTIDSERKSDHDKIRVLLETRGENGYIIIPPTKGYKFDSKVIQFDNMPILTDHERNSVIAVCRSFDELEETYKQTKAPTPIDVTGTGKTTIEAFNECHTPIEFLEAAGWQFKYQRGDNMHYVRPGKTLREGIGAGYSESLNLIRIFTSSTQFDCNKTYNTFQTYSILEHGGDYSAACKALYHAGYGDRLSKTTDSHKEKASQITSGDKNVSEKASNDKLMSEIYNKRLDITVKPKNKPNTLFMKCFERGKWIGLGGDGDLINFFGREKTRKSAAAACATSCFLKDGRHESLLFRADFDGRNVMHFDTEQSEFYHHRLAGQMMFQQGLSKATHPSNFFSFHIMPYTKIDRLNFVKYSIDKTPNIGCVFVDGVVDLCRNYNDLEESSDLVTFFMNMASKRDFLLIDVLHNARSTGSARGHLGTELLNKAQCNINVTKEEGARHSTLEIQSIRGDYEPKGFDFWHDDLGNIELYN
jgi:hypothetical protein